MLFFIINNNYSNQYQIKNKHTKTKTKESENAQESN